MLDHIVINVADLDGSRSFYEQALEPLGLGVVLDLSEAAGTVGFGSAGKPGFWIREGDTSAPVHVAFAAADRDAVDAFYSAAMEAGATDNGAPGVREIYHPNYYGAFVLDPDGHNIEAVRHAP